jgi:hypothetical protein
MAGRAGKFFTVAKRRLKFSFRAASPVRCRSILSELNNPRHRGCFCPPCPIEIDEMATPKLKLVTPNREQQTSGVSAESRGFAEPWRQQFWGLSQLTSTLVGLLLGTAIVAAFIYAYNRIGGTTTPVPATSGATEYVVTTTVFIHSEPGESKKTRIGLCEQGTRIRVIGTQAVGSRTWYEIEISSQHKKSLDSAARKWVASECVTMLRK